MTTFSIQAWNTANQAILDEEKKLNHVLASPILNETELDEIDKNIRNSYKLLKQFSKELQERIEDQAKGCFSRTGKTVIKIQIGAAIATLLMTGAKTYAVFGQDFIGKCVAYTISTLAGWTAYGVNAYVIKVRFSNVILSSLLNINKDGIAQGRILKKLIKQIKKLNTQSKEKESSSPDIKIELRDPEQEISHFLENYDNLKYKSNEVYSKIIPLLIKKLLPDNDPLKEELHKLESSDILAPKMDAALSLPVDYMHSSPDFNKKDSSPKKSWQNEQFSRQESGELSTSRTQQLVDKHIQTWVNFQEQLNRRFNFYRYIPYLDTDQGRITHKGNIPYHLVGTQQLDEIKLDIKY